MKKATFDPSKNLDLYFRKNRNGSVQLSFFSGGIDYDISALVFVFRSDFDVAVSSATNVLTLTFSKDTEIKRSSYLWELYNETSGKTWLSGTAYFTESLSAEVEDTTEFEININSDQVEITINGGIGSGIPINWNFATSGVSPGDYPADLTKRYYATDDSVLYPGTEFWTDGEGGWFYK